MTGQEMYEFWSGCLLMANVESRNAWWNIDQAQRDAWNALAVEAGQEC